MFRSSTASIPSTCHFFVEEPTKVSLRLRCILVSYLILKLLNTLKCPVSRNNKTRVHFKPTGNVYKKLF